MHTGKNVKRLETITFYITNNERKNNAKLSYGKRIESITLKSLN